MNLKQRLRVLRGLEPDPLPEVPDDGEGGLTHMSHAELERAIKAAKPVKFVPEGDDEEEGDD